MGKASWRVLKQDRELLTLPVIGAAVSIVVGLLLLVPFLAVAQNSSEFNPVTGQDTISAGAGLIMFLIVAVGYFALVLIGQLFAGAIVHGAYTRLTGGDPTVASSFQGAFSKIKQLVPWALATGTVGIILDKLRDMGFIGRIIAGMISFAWSTATFIVLPILVIEGFGPRAAYERSRALMSGRYGDSATATFGLGIIGLVAGLIGVGLIFGGVAMGGIGFALSAIGVVWLIAVSVFMSTLTGVFRAAMYMYATTGQVPGEFQDTNIATAFA